MKPIRGRKGHGGERVRLLFGAAAAFSLASLLVHHHRLVRYACSQTAMVLAEQPFLPKPAGLEHPAFAFPSVAERVRYYMGSWYDAAPAEQSYNGTPGPGHSVCDDVPVFDPESKRPINDRPFMFDESTLRTMRLKRWTNFETSTYEHDSLKYFYREGQGEGEQHRRNDPSNSTSGTSGSRGNRAHGGKGRGRRIIFQFGDGMVQGRQAQHPVMVKARNAAAGSVDNGHRREEPTSVVPILALINAYRHYGGMSGVRQYFPWEEKKDAVVFRGVSTGARLERLRPFIVASRESRGGADPEYDIAFTKIIQKDRPANETGGLLGELLTCKELTRYRYLLVLPGNDVSSGLKWMLYSDSVVIMPEPRKVSWAMEDRLVPFVHYIPVREDLSNLHSQLQWARRHEALCRNISKHATQYMIRLYVSREAQEETQEIRRLIAERYQMLYGAILEQC